MNKKNIAAIIFACTILTANGANAKEINDWAFNSFTELNAGGILNTDIISMNLTDNITRGEFCRLITNIYEAENKITLGDYDYGIFTDTVDEAVLKAYKLGAVNGKGNGTFCPYDAVTRQEMAVMISRLLDKMSDDYVKYKQQIDKYNAQYKDSALTDSWAVEDMAAASANGIINGDENGFANPKKSATREEAICMVDRVWRGYAKTRTSYSRPVIMSTSDTMSASHIISIEWTAVPNAASYRVLIKQEGTETLTVISGTNERYISNVNTQMTAQKDITVYVAAYLNNGMQVFSNPITFEKMANSQSAVSAEYTIPQNFLYSGSSYGQNDYVYMDEKEQKAFPDGHYFETEEEARANMEEVTVPVWRLNSDGTKTASQKTLTVNKNLVDDVWSIFTEIYNDPSQFPIKDAGGFSWRKTAGGSVSQHSYGTCIDINYNENYYVKPDGTPITGSYWKPGEDPYSIAEDSAVVRIFAKYGWEWGGNAWSDAYAKDYMHFTYLGR